MARFTIEFCSSIHTVLESVMVVGCKEPDYKIKKVNGAEEAATYDYYYVKKTNKYGIKWVICKKGYWKGHDIAASKQLPGHASINIIKMY